MHPLTDRELEVARVIQRGASAYSEIAERLKPPCSVRTAQGYVERIFLKLPPAGDTRPLMRVVRWAVSQPTFRTESPAAGSNGPPIPSE